MQCLGGLLIDLVDSRYILESTPDETGECVEWLISTRLCTGASPAGRRWKSDWINWIRTESSPQNRRLVGIFYMIQIKAAIEVWLS